MNPHITPHHTFRPLLFLIVALALGEARSETLVIGTNQPLNFSLNVPTNQAVVIYGGRLATSAPDIYWRITQFGQLYLIQMTGTMYDSFLTPPVGRPSILAGPLLLELFIPQTSGIEGSWMSYEVLPLAGLKTVVVPGMATNSVAIASGVNFRLLSTSQDWTMGISWQLVSGNARASLWSDSLKSIFDMEFSGPVGLEIGNNGMQARWFTYSLHSGAVQLLPAGVLAASGANGLSVEESSDLVNWSVAAVMLRGASPSRFYRLKASQ